MSIDTSTCIGGCFVNQFNPNVFKPSWDNENCKGLTSKEKEILKHLVEAWQLYVSLDKKHPDDDNEFRTAIHDAQKMMALRVARRVDPTIWFQPE